MDEQKSQQALENAQPNFDGLLRAEYVSPDTHKTVEQKIGIGITTHNRSGTFSKTFDKLIEFLPSGAVVCVVDDASDKEYVSNLMGSDVLRHRFETNVGIARAKNKCLEMLFNAGCEHFFLFDDDTHPMVDHWWLQYVYSKEHHLMYIFKDFVGGKSPNDMIELYRDNEIVAYSHVRGCMLYYKRLCLYVAGGMDVSFGKWGHEHGDLSNRIYNYGLTRFRYMDVPNSNKLFYAGDEQEHGRLVSTVPGGQRVQMLANTKPIYDAHYNMALYCDFKDQERSTPMGVPHFLSTYFTSLVDPQRGAKWPYDPLVLHEYLQSIPINYDFKHDCKIVILNDHHDSDPALDTTLLEWVKVQVSINPYFQRWITYYEYLIRNMYKISWVFMTDCTDVELINMPYPEPGKIYVGSEPGMIAQSQWITFHHKHPDLQRFYQSHGRKQIVNAGIIGGYLEDILPFVRAMIDTYSRMAHDQQVKRSHGPGMTDMGIFNYVAYTMFPNKISRGPHVNTTFKANERNNISWFKHK